MNLSRKKMRLLVVYNDIHCSEPDQDLDQLSESAVQDEVEIVSKTAIEMGHVVKCLSLLDVKNTVDAVEAFHPDLIFNLCEGFRGEARHESHIAGLWELLDIPYTGNSSQTLGLAQNKVFVKKLLSSKKIPTPAYQLFKTTPKNAYLPFPLIVKPSQEDASLGITQQSVVHDLKMLQKQVDALIKKYHQAILAERFIAGREFNISILDCPDPTVLAVSEIDFTHLNDQYQSIVSYEAKWIENHPLYLQTPAICPARIESELRDHIEDIALQVYKLLGCRDYARVDIRLDVQGHIFVLECNPNPDISADAGFTKALKAAGLSYSDFVDTVIHQTMKRMTNGKYTGNAKRRS